MSAMNITSRILAKFHRVFTRFNTFETNLLAIPSIVMGIVTMFCITLISEIVDDRSLVAMAEDLWTLPFLIAIYLLPAKPNQWLFYVCLVLMTTTLPNLTFYTIRDLPADCYHTRWYQILADGVLF